MQRYMSGLLDISYVNKSKSYTVAVAPAVKGSLLRHAETHIIFGTVYILRESPHVQ